MVNRENICDYNKAEYENWFYGYVPLPTKNISKKQCEKNKSPKEDANYCEEHGCHVCNYVEVKYKYKDPSLDIKLELEAGGESVCSLECKKKADTNYYFEDEKIRSEAEKKE